MGWLLGTLALLLFLSWLGRRFLGGAATPEAPTHRRVAAPSAATSAEEAATLEIGDTLDLHGVPPRDVGDLVDAFLDTARTRGYRHVRIVHGKGIGVLRRTVRARLAVHPHVVNYGDAPLPSGWGATVVQLDTAVARPGPSDLG